jgi:hypothetical protein
LTVDVPRLAISIQSRAPVADFVDDETRLRAERQ